MSQKPYSWLVRTWFGLEIFAVIALAIIIAIDWIAGEGVAHLGWRFTLSYAAMILLVLAIVTLPLLVVAVVRDKRSK